MSKRKQFDFGENWVDFVQSALTEQKVKEAAEAFNDLTSEICIDIHSDSTSNHSNTDTNPNHAIENLSFLDIGFGQGLSLLNAYSKGWYVVGLDINPRCNDALQHTIQYFPTLSIEQLQVQMGSILDSDTVTKLKDLSPNDNGYDIVHSWGVLHHTGNMYKAIEHAITLIRPGGYLILALYNRHWTSKIWWVIKRFYMLLPKRIKKIFAHLSFPVYHILAKLIIKDLHLTRGMDAFYNYVDWIGGYPYEYVSIKEVHDLLHAYNFKILKTIPTQGSTGCNEFVAKHVES